MGTYKEALASPSGAWSQSVTPAEDPHDNRLLAALGDADWQRWKPHLEPISLKRGQILYAVGQPLQHAYFPTSAIVSLVHTTEAGKSTEFAVVGNDGVVGTSILLRANTTTSSGSVLTAGQGLRIGATVVLDEFDRFPSVRDLLLRYTQALITQVTHTAVCYRHHTVDQQVCTLLLHCLDRLRCNEVVVTQEQLASVLGVRREGVTLVAGHLRVAGLIRCRRGHIEVLDRVGLEHRCCECYAVVRNEYDRLLTAVPHAHQAAEHPDVREAEARRSVSLAPPDEWRDGLD